VGVAVWRVLKRWQDEDSVRVIDVGVVAGAEFVAADECRKGGVRWKRFEGFGV
jgi:hypothetical protein